ncbi:hypothetical protein J7438_23415 [Thalassotalea sp. G20_0]|uniref:hypothetical protein n=1 Tax=Thalassotalea sp. G20_0 TaxID=2821093 RepID=UPI001ADD1506|nr:hypothetical protein [Thalassotalea sp. G20_0]MBO9497015.1 hypothetical protein [Thalassotalea sp. G20_0]
MDATSKPQSGAQLDSNQSVDDLTELLGEVLFNHRETRVTTDGLVAETTSQTDHAMGLDSSPRDVPVVDRSVSMPSDGGFAYSPADTGLRLEYLHKHPIAEGLNSDPDYSALIKQLCYATSDREKLSLFEKLQEKVECKHGSNRLIAISLLQHLSKCTNLAEEAFRLINNCDQFSSINGNIDQRSLLYNVGILDALYSQLTDLSKLLKGELCTESLSVIRYTNMIFPEPMYSLDVMNLRQLSGYGEELSHHKEQVVLRRNWVPANTRLIELITIISRHRETELRIYASISQASANYLNDYLRANNIDRLFFPMAGSGYFSKSMMEAGMPSTCFDINPPNNTYTRVNKADVFVSVDKFAKILASTGGNMDSSALVLDAPQPVFMDNGRWVDADEFLPRVIKSWFDRGGKNLLVISEASDQELLFSSKALTSMGIAMMPVIPGFPPEIFKGLGEHIGVCGLYRIDKK